MTKKTPPEARTAPVTPETTTLSGYAIQIMGFIPIPKGDLEKQAEIPLLLLAIQKGEKTVADLAEHLQGLEFRQQYSNKRFPVEEAARMLSGGTEEPNSDPEASNNDGDGDQPNMVE